MAHKIVTGVAALAALAAFASPLWSSTSVSITNEAAGINEGFTNYYGAIYSIGQNLGDESANFTITKQMPVHAIIAQGDALLEQGLTVEDDLWKLQVSAYAALAPSVFLAEATEDGGFQTLQYPVFIGGALAVLMSLVSLGLALTDKLGPLRFTAALAAIGCFAAFGAYMYTALGTPAMQAAAESCDKLEEITGGVQKCVSSAIGSETTAETTGTITVFTNNVAFAGPFLAVVSGLLYVGAAVLAHKNQDEYAIEPYGAAY